MPEIASNFAVTVLGVTAATISRPAPPNASNGLVVASAPVAAFLAADFKLIAGILES